MPHRLQIWHQAPFLRLLLATVAGILLQWWLMLPAGLLVILFAVLFTGILSYSFLPLSYKFRLRLVNGVCLHTLIAIAAALLVWRQDIRNHLQWFGQHQQQGAFVIRLVEPLVEKPNSYKAIAEAQYMIQGQNRQPVKGKLIAYFKKDSVAKSLGYGSVLVVNKHLQPIRNSGNPAAFDYSRYNLFQGISHQVFVSEKDYAVLPLQQQNPFWTFIYGSRRRIVEHLKNYISGKKEQGLAEALLIGYKDELDKNLVQAYSNTGVVHIIAISGLHLGLIYGLLLALTRPLASKKLRRYRLVLILASLWLFSILAGAQPSVLRSAVMFSFLAAGEAFSKKTSPYNLLALSAFVLLAFNPFLLWDVGFQLSYAAVLGILAFYKPVVGWFHFHNKAVGFLWSVIAVTLAAQVFTLPLSIYHFHQFPILFLVSNLVAVPLSSLILYGEIFLCSIFWFESLAGFVGDILAFFIRLMNSYVERIDSMDFSTWNGLSISPFQTFLLLLFAAFVSFWLLEKQGWMLKTAGIALLCFLLLRSHSFLLSRQQKMLIVYNVPRHKAIDLIYGRRYQFIGDEVLRQDGFIRNFHLQPSRIYHRTSENNLIAPSAKQFEFDGKKVVVIDSTFDYLKWTAVENCDVVVLSGNLQLQVGNLKMLNPKHVVIDGSVPHWKSKRLQQQLRAAGLPVYAVADRGAFVMKWR